MATPDEAINFDYYEHPRERIAYHERGFTYKTDGQCAGQIGVKKDACASLIGFHDRTRSLACIREIERSSGTLHFNIADNEQPDGPYSASDVYSIFNSDPDMRAFELETVGGARLENGLLLGSELVSRTTFAVFQSASDLDRFVESALGSGVVGA